MLTCAFVLCGKFCFYFVCLFFFLGGMITCTWTIDWIVIGRLWDWEWISTLFHFARFGSVQFGKSIFFFFFFSVVVPIQSKIHGKFRFWINTWEQFSLLLFRHVVQIVCVVQHISGSKHRARSYMQSICVRFPFVYQLLHTTDKSRCSFKWKVQFRFFKIQRKKNI